MSVLCLLCPRHALTNNLSAHQHPLIIHTGVSGIAVGDSVTVKVDYSRRAQIVPNHTFTHVLNFALRETLGDHVDQKGSIVLPDK